MHTVEHTDRFVVSLPNGQSLTIAKDGLKPDRMAELRAQSLPGMDEGGDTTDAAIKKIESEIADLESEAGDGGFAGYAARVNAADPEAVRAARYGTGDDRDAGTLSEGLGGLGVAPVAAPGLPMGAPIDTGGVDTAAIENFISPSPQTSVPTRDMGDAPPSDVAIPYVDMRAPTTLPEGFSPEPIVAPDLIPSFQGTINVPPAPVGFSPFSLSPITQTVAPVPRGPRELSEAQIKSIRDGSGAIAPPQPIAASESMDPEIVAKMKASLAEVGRAPQIEGIGASRMRPFVRPQGMVDALAGAEKAATDLGVLDAEHQRQRAEMMLAHEAQSADLVQRLDAEREAEYRRQQDLFSDVYSGKIDPNRLWGRMDTGSRGLALLGLALGAIGAGNTGVNATVGVLDKMIDRDVDAQAKDLDRRRTLYSEYLRMGYQREQARQMTKAALMETQAAQMQRLAAQNGSPRAIASAAAATAEMKMKAEAWFQQAQDAHAGREMQMIGLEQQRQIANMQAQQAARRAEAQLQVATAKQLSDQAKLQVTLRNGKVVVAADSTARADLARRQEAHQEFVKGLDKLDQLRRENPGGTVVPAFLAWLGSDKAEASKVGNSLAGAVRLAYLKAQGAGAYDKGSGTLSENIILDPTSFFGTGDDKSYFESTRKLRELANESFLATVTANTRGGSVYSVTATPVGGQ